MPNNKLYKIISYAVEMVPYYKKLFNERNINIASIREEGDLANIPLLEKDIIQSLSESFMSSEYLKYPKSAEIIVHSTSGSTGKPLSINWSYKDYIRSMYPLWIIRKKTYKIDPDDKLLSFHTNIFSANTLENHEQKLLMKGGRILSLSNLNISKNKIKYYYEEMARFNPKWMSVQPSVAYLLADYIKNNNKKIPEALRYIELTGEYLFDNILNKIKDVFSVSVANMYGMVEVNGIACECVNGKMHVLESNVIVEILNSNKETVNIGEEGEIYVTSLTNTAMPLIRYATGDRGVLYKGSICSCGNKSHVLVVKAGRISEFVDMQDGDKLTPHIFCYPIAVINDNMGNPIKQFQIVQNDIGSFTITLTLEISFKGWKRSIKKYYCELMRDTSLKSVKLDFIFKDNIYPDKESGKYKFFINKTKSKEEMLI